MESAEHVCVWSLGDDGLVRDFGTPASSMSELDTHALLPQAASEQEEKRLTVADLASMLLALPSQDTAVRECKIVLANGAVVSAEDAKKVSTR